MLARMVADRLNQQQQQQQQQMQMQQQQNQMMGPGMGNVGPVSTSSMGPNGPMSPQGGMLRGGPIMGSRMEFMNMQQQLQGGPPMSPQMNSIRGQMMRGPPPPGGIGGPSRMQGYGPRGM